MKRMKSPSTFFKRTAFFFALCLPNLLFSQDNQDTLSDWDRTFMPAIQMGYVVHGSDELTGGLMTQTSLEYRHVSNLVFRLNFDDINGEMNVQYPVDQNVTFSGKTSFLEFIGGIGYRDIEGKHNFTAYLQGGLRSYGYPEFTSDGVQINLDYDSRRVGIMRYSLGYEFALAPKLFLSVETLVSHTLQKKDFWSEDPWAYGITVGLTAPLF